MGLTRFCKEMQRLICGESNPNLSFFLPCSSARLESQIIPQIFSALKDGENGEEVQERGIVENFYGDRKAYRSDEIVDSEKFGVVDVAGPGVLMKGLCGLRISERVDVKNEASSGDSPQIGTGSSHNPPPPIPPPKPATQNLYHTRRFVSGRLNAVRIGPSTRAVACLSVSTKTSPSELRPFSPRSLSEKGYIIADEQNPCFVPSYYDSVHGKTVEIQALAEMRNRPIHSHSYGTEPIHIFQGSYDSFSLLTRLGYHHGSITTHLMNDCWRWTWI